MAKAGKLKSVGRLLLGLLAVGAVCFAYSKGWYSGTMGGSGTGTTAVTSEARGTEAIVEAFRDGRSGIQVTSRGTVTKILSDDREGSRHQRFILDLGNGHTLLVAHNIDLAPRVPVEVADPVQFHGQYEWNDRGGVLHWTHHDPQGQHPGGWLEHRGQKYE